MAPLKVGHLPNGLEANGVTILFAHRGEYEGRYLHLVVDSDGDIELYQSPSILLHTGLDGHPSQSLFALGEQGDLTEMISSQNAELVVPAAWGKWEYFFGISQLNSDFVTNSQIFESGDVIQPLRDDHFRSVVELFDRDLDGSFSSPKQRIQKNNPNWLRKKDVYVEFIRLFLLSNGLAIFPAPNQAKIMWFSDSYKGVHSLSAESLVSNLKQPEGKTQIPKNKFLNVWCEAEAVNASLATSLLFESGLLSEENFRRWFKSSPIHKMRLGISYFEQFRVSSESFNYLIDLLATDYSSDTGINYSLALAPWHGRVLRAM